MITTRLFSSNATRPEASIRGVTSRCTGLMPSTSIASISSRMVRDPRSAHIAVAPAPATISTVTSGPTWVTAPNAAPAPDRSAAPSSRSRMFSVKTDQHRERDRHQQRRRQRHPRHEPATAPGTPATETAARNTNRTASADIANNPPTACIGPDKLLIGGNPADHRSGPLPRAMAGSFQDRHCRHSGRAHRICAPSRSVLRRLD